jgi:2,2-dialkylglycine decarboxylase (pyruvate)
LAQQHPAIGQVRGRGLLQAIELVTETGSPATDLGPLAASACIASGLLFSVRRKGSVFRFTPPFTTTIEQLDRAAEILDVSLRDAAQRVGRRTGVEAAFQGVNP